jgi:cytochrome c oxidase subunit 2
MPRPHSAPPRRGVRRLGLGALTAVAVLALSGCSSGQFERLGMPAPATDRAAHALSLWQGAWIAALAVGVIVWGLIIFASVKFRRHEGDGLPKQVRYHLPVEILYTFIPFVIVGVLFYFTVRDQNKILNVDTASPPAHSITVVGQQWSWTFNYNEKKAVGAVVYDKGNPSTLPELWLPEGQKVGVTLHSPDVNHSFFVPVFLFKMDVLAGKDNYFEFTPTKLGTFQGKCAELCGVYHSRMLFVVKVVSPADYQTHLEALKAAGQIGPALGGEASHTVSGMGTKETGE